MGVVVDVVLLLLSLYGCCCVSVVKVEVHVLYPGTGVGSQDFVVGCCGYIMDSQDFESDVVHSRDFGCGWPRPLASSL